MPAAMRTYPTSTRVAEGLAELKARGPLLSRAVVKLNEGFSGEGNAVFSFADAPVRRRAPALGHDRLPRLAFEARGDELGALPRQAGPDGRGGGGIRRGGGEALALGPVPGRARRHARPDLDPRPGPGRTVRADLPRLRVSGRCRLPAGDPGRGLGGGAPPARLGVLGRFGIDFISVRRPRAGTTTRSRSTCARAARRTPI